MNTRDNTIFTRKGAKLAKNAKEEKKQLGGSWRLGERIFRYN